MTFRLRAFFRKKRGFFCLFWLFLLSLYIYDSLHVSLPRDGEILYYFTDKKDDIKYVLCKALRNAKKEIFLSSFGITDEHVTNLLSLKENSGVAVKVAYDPKVTNLFSLDKKQSPYLGKGIMHRKIAMIDRELIFLGSTNMTPFSLSIHRNLLAAIRSSSLSKAILENQIYHNGGFTYYPMPLFAKEAKKKLITQIDGAKKHILVAMYTLTHKELVEALVKAKKRGIEITVYIDRGMRKGICEKWVKILLEAKIVLKENRGNGLLHHKCALIDDSFVFGSANWTKAAFGKNEEYLLIEHLLSPDSKKTILKFFHTLDYTCKEFS